MLQRTLLLDTPEIRVSDVRCPGGTATWSDPEEVQAFGIVLIRSGAFRRRGDGGEMVADAAVGYVQRRGMEEQMAHPHGGDVCTSIGLGDAVLSALLGEDGRPPAGPVFTTPDVDLAHRRLVSRSWRGADTFEATEAAVVIAGHVLCPPDRSVPVPIRSPTPVRRGTLERRRRLVDDARAVLAVERGVGLVELAARVGASPYHLSRVFAQVTGLTVSRYRSRLRVRRALDRLADGERDLAALAADLGFADHAHLTRTLRAETGLPPSLLRGVLCAPVP